jgi:flagellar hook assembly protein FlgD
VVLAIHDLRGGRLRELVGPGGSDAIEFMWDGRDADGHPAPAGTYLARVMSGTETGRATRFVLLR